MGGPRLADFAALAWREWRHHPWRHAAALLAVALGVALASSVQWINASALAEFSAALRATQGQPDLSVRAAGSGTLPDAAPARLGAAPGVLQATPVIVLGATARAGDGRHVALQLLGVDALGIAAVAPGLLPWPAAGADRLAALDPDHVFLNAAARAQLGIADGQRLTLRAGTQQAALRVAGAVGAGGAPLAVIDIATAQDRFGFAGRVSRVDLRLAPGAEPPTLAPGWRAERPDDALQRVAQMSRAYRVNLTVLALVALFVGGFLVYSVIALSVAQRLPGFALLGVLGMTAAERRRLVVLECLGLGMAGSALGLAAGAALAAAGLRWLAGDLGGGFFPGVTPPLRIEPAALALFFVLGTATAVLGGWQPARAAERLQPARALKGYSSLDAPAARAWPGWLLCAAGVGLAFVPPLAGLPLAAYAAVGCLLFGGIALLPWLVQLLLARWPLPGAALPRLALQRALFQRHTATAVVAGVVAALALSVALTVMVDSFRGGVAQWLDTLLPADLYVRTGGRSGAGDASVLPPAFAAAAAALPGVARVQGRRLRMLSLSAQQPAVALIARPLADPARALPLVAEIGPAAAGDTRPDCFVSEAMLALHGAQPATTLALPLDGGTLRCRIRGVWRDYASQFGSVVIDLGSYQRLTGDRQLSDLALWLRPDADTAALGQALAALPDRQPLDIASAGEIRAASLRIFDRSFAVTRWLQAVAVAVGLVGVAASLSAQVAARRKEFGLLAHLGLTRRQIVALVAGETAAWLGVGALAGTALGLAVSAVLVHVVNPQSFHWTMEMVLPGWRLAALALAVLAAGTATAALSARRAAGHAAVRSVKEDW